MPIIARPGLPRHTASPTKTHNRQKFKPPSPSSANLAPADIIHPAVISSCPTLPSPSTLFAPDQQAQHHREGLPAASFAFEPTMRPILLSGHERALTQIRYVLALKKKRCYFFSPLSSLLLVRSFLTNHQRALIATTSMAISSSPSPRTSRFASGSPTTASVSEHTTATSVPSGPSMSTPPRP